MRAARASAVAVLCVAIVAVVAQQPNAAGAQSSTSAAEMNPATGAVHISGELVERLDSKTAKVGDRVFMKTRSTVRTVGGVEIPKGSKLIGRVTGVEPLGASEANAQIALALDRIELKGGQSLSIQGEIQSLAPAGSESDNGGPDPMATSPGNTSPGHAPGDMYGSTPIAAPPAQIPRATQAGSGSSLVNVSGSSDGGSIVARSGDLVIRTTAIPGLLLANHEQASPAAPSSSILLGVKRDIHLESGTRLILVVLSAETTKPIAAN